MKPIINIIRTGRINYSQGLKLQEYLAKQPASHPEVFRNYLLLQEHYPVYTIGIRTKDYSNDDEERLRGFGADFFRTNRGGLITFHGPGQLVAYPIINLKQFNHPSIRWYVGTLESTVIDACKNIGICNAQTTKDTGIWVGDNKICAIGIHASRFVTTHGIGLNACTDLSWFNHIVPCGITGKGVTSLSQELGRNVTIQEAADIFLNSFKKLFNCNSVECDEDEVREIFKQAKRV